MADYIRRRSPGGTFFFTIRLADRGSDLLVRQIHHLRRAMRETKERHAFHIDAIAVLPSVIHTIWTLPEGDTNYPNRIGMLKSKFSRSQPMPAHRTLIQIQRGEKAIWQRRYWEHEIRDEADFARHCDLIYLSPVHAGLCPTPQDWPHTSLHRDLSKGSPAPDPVGHGAARLHLTVSRPANRYRDDIQRVM
ncbi:MAG: REP-associated tyrosine transposase [Sulfitobacter sp.]